MDDQKNVSIDENMIRSQLEKDLELDEKLEHKAFQLGQRFGIALGAEMAQHAIRMIGNTEEISRLIPEIEKISAAYRNVIRWPKFGTGFQFGWFSSSDALKKWMEHDSAK